MSGENTISDDSSGVEQSQLLESANITVNE